MTIFSIDNPDFKRGRVIVVEDGEIVADGRLDDLVMIDDKPEIHSDIYLHPADAAEFDAWCVAQLKRRLN